jgi:hypothetical protein
MNEEIEVNSDPIGFSPYEDIGACSMAIGALAEFDSGMLGSDERELIAETRSMCLKIIHTAIKEIYESNCYE